MRVCIDAGHGYTKANRRNGTAGNGLVEDDVALRFAHKLRWYLIDHQIRVTLTRAGRMMAGLALGDRGRMAVRDKCELFVSIHCNGFSDPTAHGAEVIVVQGDHRSVGIASKLLDVLAANGMRRRGVKPDNSGQHKSIRVLRDTYRTMPACLVELGFVTNKEDADRMRNRGWMDAVAASMARVIAEVMA